MNTAQRSTNRSWYGTLGMVSVAACGLVALLATSGGRAEPGQPASDARVAAVSVSSEGADRSLLSVVLQARNPSEAIHRAEFFPEPQAASTGLLDVPPPSFEGKVVVRDEDGNWVDVRALPVSGGAASALPAGPDSFLVDGAENGLAIDHANGNNVLATNNPGFLGVPVVHTSTDGNSSWTPQAFPNGAGTYTGSPFDPWANAGNAAGEFFATLIRRDTGSANAHCVIARSVGGGAYALFFERLKDVFQDREMVDIDLTTVLGGGAGAVHDGKVYLGYDDFGVGGAGYVGSFLQVISPGGAPLVELTISTLAGFNGSKIQPVAGTTDGQVYLMTLGVSGALNRHLSFHEVTGGGAGLILNKSVMIFPATGQRLGVSNRWGVNGHRANSHMYMDMDRSGGPRNGHLFVVSDRNPNPGNASLDQGDVFLSVSTNGAVTWATTAIPGIASGKTQFFTMIDVDEQGWIHVGYYQNESGVVDNGVLNAGAANVYCTLSRDGGLTWTTPLQVNDAVNTLDYFEPPPDLSARNYYLIGDYCQIKATGTGAATKSYVAWSGYDKDRTDVFLNDKRDRILVTTVTKSEGQDRKFSQPPVACECNGDVDASGGLPGLVDEIIVAFCIDGDCSGCINSCDVNCDGHVSLADVETVTCLFTGQGPDVCCPLGEDIPSNIDWTDMDPNVVVVDDFVSDGRPINAVRWWGSEIPPPCAKPVPAGEDCWSTACGGGTQVEFGSLSIPQIPADFFGPGSDPFVGTIEFQGRSFFDDTRIRRTQDMCLGGTPPVSDTVPIEIVKLDLIGCAPITVTFALGPPEQYDVEIFLDGPQTQGLMTVTKNNPTGGTYDTNLPVRAGFRFTNTVSGAVHTLTANDIGGALDLLGNGLPWVQDQPPVGVFCGAGGFYPGVAKDDTTCCPESCHAGPSPGHDHCVTPPKCPACAPCAKPVPAGEDCWSTQCGGGTQVEFGSASIPTIPADFFDPGADPFNGTIEFQGRNFFDDTRIRRTQDMCLDGTPPVSDTVAIEIVKLDLVGCAPATVTYNGGMDPELWDVEVFLDGPQTQGLMTVTKNNPTGGTYDTDLPVRAGFRFTRQSDGVVRTLAAGDVGGTLDLSGSGLPWVQDQPLVGVFCGAGGFYPGVAKDDTTCCPESCHRGPAPGHDHCVIPPKCPACGPTKACDLGTGCLGPCGGDPNCGCAQLVDGTGACMDLAVGPLPAPCDVDPQSCEDFFGPGFKCFFDPCFFPEPFCTLNCPTVAPSSAQVESRLAAAAAKAERAARTVDRSGMRLSAMPCDAARTAGGAVAATGVPADFQVDDGFAENCIGVNDGGEPPIGVTFGWANQFENTTGGPITLGEIEIAFGCPGGGSGVAVGDAVDGVVWIDAAATGNMANATMAVRWSLPGGVHASDGTTFATHTIPGGVAIPAGAQFYVGAGDIQTEIDSAIRFPASLDQTTTNVKSWVFFGPAIFDPVNLAGQTIDLIDNFGFPGNWLVRANLIEEQKCAPAGIDCFTTLCDPANPTRFDFAGSPIPADFFFPGSPPFSGVVDFGGLGAFPGDTIVRRLGEMCFPNPLPASDTVPIEIVQLDLVSCSPIDVGGTLFDVFVGLAGPVQTQGTLTATKDQAGGGTYTAVLPVDAEFTFQLVGGGPLLGPILAPPIVMQTNPPGVWSQDCCDTGCGGSGFFPGWTTDPAGDPCCEPTCHPDPAGGHDHCVYPPDCPPCPPPPPICGDNVVNQLSEQCDGTDDAACPGLCRPDCTCPIGGEGPDGWFISFHEPIVPGAPPLPPLGLYFCNINVVTQTLTALPACDAHPVIEYNVDLDDCCLVHATPDSRSGLAPAVKNAFFEEQCFEYGIDIQAVFGREFIQDPLTLECIEVDTGTSITQHTWGWHTTSIERGRDFGLQQAFQGPVTKSGPGWLYGPWVPIAPVCSVPNMAFELLTNTPGDSDADGNGIPDKCECDLAEPPALEASPVIKSRYISFVPGSPGKLTALRVTLTASVQFPAEVGGQWWVVDPETVCQNSGQTAPPCQAPVAPLPTTMEMATLGCLASPLDLPCYDWGSLGLIHVESPNIVSGATYRVEAIDCECPVSPGSFSAGLSIDTAGWVDICGPGATGACQLGPEGTTDINDLVAILNTLENNRLSLLKPRVDFGRLPLGDDRVDRLISVDEVINWVKEFETSAGYPFSGPTGCP